jgi:peptide/nickel transport system substrate-binding protein
MRRSALFFALLALGCVADQPGRSERALTTTVLSVQTFDDVDSLDPSFAYFSLSWQIEYATELKLLNYRDVGGTVQLVADAADLPSISADGTVYTFHLAAGNAFNTGEPVTAASFKRAFTRAATAGRKGALPGGFFIQDVKSVSGDGDMLTITLKQPAGDFLHRVAMPFFAAVPAGTPNPLQSFLPSAGPYYVASYVPAQYDFSTNPPTTLATGSIVLRRNPNYHGPRPHVADEIDYTTGVPVATVAANVISGVTDYSAEGVPPDQLAALLSTYGGGAVDGPRLLTNSGMGYNYLSLNSSAGHFFADANARRAVNYALDRNAIAAVLGATPNDDYLPPNMPGYANFHPYLTQEVAKAQSLLGGQTPPILELWYTIHWQPVIDLVAEELANVGLIVHLTPFASGRDFYSSLSAPGAAYDIAFNGWLADYPDPFDFLNILLDPQYGNDYPNFSDPGFLSQLNAAISLVPPDRYTTYAQLDRDAINLAPMAVLGNINSYDFFSARVNADCVIYNGVYGIDLGALCVR